MYSSCPVLTNRQDDSYTWVQKIKNNTEYLCLLCFLALVIVTALGKKYVFKLFCKAAQPEEGSSQNFPEHRHNI